jgi:hypothetical protein
MEVVPENNGTLPTAKILGIAVFESGFWNGERVTDADLQDIVDASKELNW